MVKIEMKMGLKQCRRFALVVLLIISHFASAQYVPFFQNYALTEYNAGNQNWDISVAESGKVYVANDKFLVEFDGVKWSFYQLPNKTIIRSVLVHNGLIYTGSYQEFGYWKEDSKGELVYTSLGNFKEQKESLDEEFWQIFEHNNSIYFRSFSNLYRYNSGEIKRFRPESTIISCSLVHGDIYVSTFRNGIFKLEQDQLVSSFTDNKLFEVKIVSIIDYNNGLLLTTALNGCFYYKDNVLEEWNSDISEIIKEQQLNDFLVLPNGNMVFGTIKNGVYITDNAGKIHYQINRENGLLNNTVLSLELGANNKLWLGLDNGAALVDFNYNHVLYNDSSGKLGAVYDIINYRNTLYIGSNTGLFYIDPTDNKLNFIEGSQGQVWSLKEINGQLFCGHNNGTFIVEGKKLKEKISNFTGGWVIKKVPEKEDLFVQGTYAGLVKYQFGNNKWQVSHMGSETIPIKFLVFENSHTAWAAHAYRGLFRVQFNSDYSAVEFKNYEKNKGLWSDFNVRVHKIKNDICFKTNRGWQKYEALIDSIVPHKLINNALGVDTDIISESDSNVLVVKNAKDKISFVSQIEDEYHLNFPNKLIQKRLVVDAESVSQLNDSTYTLNLYDGFMLINQFSNSTKDSLQKPIIEQIEVNKQLISLESNQEYELPYNKNIGVSVSSPHSINHFFEYALSTGEAKNWYPLENEKLELSSLSNGSYIIYFRTVNIAGEVSLENSLRLTILPPWYKNSWFYLAVLVLTVVVFYWLHKKKISKEQKALQNKLVIEQEILLKEKAIENDKKIVQLRNESLKNEINLKSKQLANTAIALVKKNESMLEIKHELIKNKPDFDNAMVYKKLLRKIDNSIGQEDEWELFEYNFNQVHEEFFNQLKSKHPELTHKDLKICAYIKMNLLTKEIAPLMNVSIRGLETHRYRLKRKLNLDNDKSLSDYLRNFK